MTLGSSEPGGGELVLGNWDFENQKVRAFYTFCGGNTCLYSTINPAFLEVEVADRDDAADHEHGAEIVHPLVDGTTVSLEVIARDAAVSLRINGVNVGVGEQQTLGTTPHLHNHPSWQITLPAGAGGDHTVSYKLTTESPLYDESRVYTSILTAIDPEPTAAPTPTATATATPTPVETGACAGDCNGDGEVTVDEIIRGVTTALTGEGLAECLAVDSDGDGLVQVDDVIRAINAALVGCGAAPEPTPTAAPTPSPTAVRFSAIQDTIFTPSCAVSPCHVGPFGAGNLVLEANAAYDELVGVEPDVFAARAAGYLLVDPGDPDNSFLLLKLIGPPLSMGSRMPSVGPPLPAEQIEMVRSWIRAGAPTDDAP